MQFEKYLRNLREEHQLLQCEMVFILKMDMALLSKIERGTGQARLEHVNLFAKA